MTATEAPHRRALTLDEYATEARRRFGPDPRDWAFTCPGCGDTATARDYPRGYGDRVGQECIGRYRARQPELPARGCLRVAYGLIGGPWAIKLEDGTIAHSFPLADPEARTAVLPAPQHPGDTSPAEDGDDAPGTPWRPEADHETAMPSQAWLTDDETEA